MFYIIYHTIHIHRIMPPKYVYTLVPVTSEYVRSHGKRKLSLLIRHCDGEIILDYLGDSSLIT